MYLVQRIMVKKTWVENKNFNPNKKSSNDKNPKAVQVSENYKQGMKVGDHFALDYMGSAEYEFGTVGETYRRVNSILNQMDMQKKTVCGKSVWFLGIPSVVEKFIPQLEKYCRDERQMLKERINFAYAAGIQEPSYNPIGGYEDLWLCLDKGEEVVFSLNQTFLQNFKDAIPRSIEYMDAQKSLTNGR